MWLALCQVIHIAERDTQVSSTPKQRGEFVNTWSIDGFVSEGVQPAELGWGTHEKRLPRDGRSHTFGSRYVLVLSRPRSSATANASVHRAVAACPIYA